MMRTEYMHGLYADMLVLERANDDRTLHSTEQMIAAKFRPN